MWGTAISILWGLALFRLAVSLPRLSATTLVTAGRWALGGALAWSAAWFLPQISASLASTWGEGTWHLAANVTLTPAIAVLGARRPGVRVWSWFVLWPLVAVFSGPTLVGLAFGGGAPAEVRIPLPMLLGVAVVLFMGAGNYVSTRYALSAGLFALAECLVLAPLSEASPPLGLTPQQLREGGTLCLSAAILWADRQSRRPTVARFPLDAVWFDFRDTFGIVWGRRLAERLNERAAAERWDWRLTDDGFQRAVPDASASTSGPPGPAGDSRIEQATRWLLRRFVEPEWIDRRIKWIAPPGSLAAVPR